MHLKALLTDPLINHIKGELHKGHTVIFEIFVMLPKQIIQCRYNEEVLCVKDLEIFRLTVFFRIYKESEALDRMKIIDLINYGLSKELNPLSKCKLSIRIINHYFENRYLILLIFLDSALDSYLTPPIIL
jgi:hypothetical protein